MLKSRGPHLAGGEQTILSPTSFSIRSSLQRFESAYFISVDPYTSCEGTNHPLKSYPGHTSSEATAGSIGYICNIFIYTSSTAQGGGKSFKNGKPIGEVSWCGAKIAERTH